MIREEVKIKGHIQFTRLTRNDLFLKLNCQYEIGGGVNRNYPIWIQIFNDVKSDFRCDTDTFGGGSEESATNKLECHYNHMKHYASLGSQRHHNKSS